MRQPLTDTQTPSHVCAIYVRVSTHTQASEGTSLEVQEARCREFAERNGLRVMNVYTDAGVSGAFLAERPGIQSALAGMKAGLFKTLVVATFSRLSRDVEHQTAIRRTVKIAGGKTMFCDVTFDDSPAGEFMYGVMGAAVQHERATIVQRSQDGKRQRAREGNQTARTIVPFGYTIVNSHDVIRGNYPPEKIGHYITLETESHWIRQIFQWYSIGGFSLSGIKRKLEESGVTTKTGLKEWRVTTIRAILKNPLYSGTAYFGRTFNFTDETRLQEGYQSPRGVRPADPENWIPIPCPKIVEPEIQHRCWELLKRNAETSGRVDRRWLLTGLVHCPVCGGRVSGKRYYGKNPLSYYICRESVSYSPKHPTCENGTCYRKDVIEPLVIRGISLIADNPDLIRESIITFQEEARGVCAEDNADLVAEKTNSQRRMNSIIEAQIQAVSAGLDGTPYIKIISECQKQIRAIDARLMKTSPQKPIKDILTPHDIALLLSGAGRVCEKVLSHPHRDDAAVNAMLRRFVDRVDIGPHEVKKIATHWQVRTFEPEVINIRFAPITEERKGDSILSVNRISIRLTLDSGFSIGIK